MAPRLVVSGTCAASCSGPRIRAQPLARARAPLASLRAPLYRQAAADQRAPSPAGVGLLALATCAVFVSLDGAQPWDTLEGRFAKVRAVGDDGCLGRSCALSDDAARKDINSWMDGFLGKGNHAGHKPRVQRGDDPMLGAKTVGLAQFRDSAAVQDLDEFFDSLDSQKTARVMAAVSKF